jgi:hypothetical protein
MPNRLPVHLLLPLVACAACGSQPASTEPAAAPTSAAHASTSSAAASSAAAPTSEGAPAADAKPTAKPTRSAPWNDSPPPGVEPLGADDKRELEKKCAAFMKAVAAKAPKNARGRLAATDALIELLRDPPAVKGVDSARCGALMKRDLVEYKARMIEADAVAGLKTMLVMLEHKLSDGGKLCSSAGPTPKELEAVRQGAYTPQRTELDAWSCLGGTPGGGNPLRAQYTAQTDPAAGTYRLTAKTFSGPTGQSTELFIEGKVSGRTVDKEAPVMRVQGP